eukprot:scaffold918_cov126-Cylindrotheca_fusiformis.AAC.55
MPIMGRNVPKQSEIDKALIRWESANSPHTISGRYKISRTRPLVFAKSFSNGVKIPLASI